MCFQRPFYLTLVKAVSAIGPCIATGCTVIHNGCNLSSWLPPFSGIYWIVSVSTPQQAALWPFPCLNIPRSKPRRSEAGPSADGPAIFWGDSILKLDFFFSCPHLPTVMEKGWYSKWDSKESEWYTEPTLCLREDPCEKCALTAL